MLRGGGSSGGGERGMNLLRPPEWSRKEAVRRRQQMRLEARRKAEVEDRGKREEEMEVEEELGAGGNQEKEMPWLATQAWWREDVLKRLQGLKYASRLALQEARQDRALQESQLLLKRLLKQRERALLLEAPHDWSDAKHAAVETRVVGPATRSLVATSKQQLFPQGFVTKHLQTLQKRVGAQRQQEAAFIESIELALMRHEEQVQRLTARARVCDENASDFCEYLQLQGRFGPLPDWMVLQFGIERWGRRPGRRFRRLAIRQARKIQRTWSTFWAWRQPEMESAARFLQRVFRGHHGRSVFEARKQILARVDSCLRKLRFAQTFKCFRSWGIFTYRSQRIKQLMRRALRQNLATTFDTLVARTQAARHARLAKMRVFMARIQHRKSLQFLVAWQEHAGKMRRARRFMMRLVSATLFRTLDAWRTLTRVSHEVRRRLALQVVRDASGAVILEFQRQAAKHTAVFVMQRVARGHLGRNRVRAIVFRLEQKQRTKAWRALESIEASKRKPLSLAALEDPLKQCNDGLAGGKQAFVEAFQETRARWWKEKKATSSKLSRLLLWARPKRVRNEVHSQLVDWLSEASQRGAAFLAERDPFSPRLLGDTHAALLKLWGTGTDSSQKTLGHIKGWHANPEKAATVPGVGDRWSGHKFILGALVLEALEAIQTQVTADCEAICLEQLRQATIRKLAAQRGTFRLRLKQLQKVTRGFLCRQHVQRQRESLLMSAEDAHARELRDHELRELAALLRRCSKEIANDLWEQGMRRAKKKLIIKRYADVRVASSVRLQAFWRAVCAREELLRKVVEGHEKLWHPDLHDYVYFNYQTGQHLRHKPALLRHCGVPDIPTPRSKERDIYPARYFREHHAAATRIQTLARMHGAREILTRVWHERYFGHHLDAQ